MKLLCFPNLVQENIVKQMKSAEVVLLSLSSLQSLGMIRKVGWKKFRQIHYDSNGNEITVYGIEENGLEHILLKFIACSLSDVCYLENLERVNISGTKILYRFTSSERIVFYASAPAIESIENHICALFGYNPEYTLCCEEIEGLLIPPKLKTTTISMFLPKSPLGSEELQEYFSSSLDQTVVWLEGEMKELLDSESSFFKTRHLQVNSNEIFDKQVLHSFQGRTLWLIESQLSDDSIIDFLQRWQSTNSYDDLQLLYIIMDQQHLLNSEYIKERIPIQRFNSLKPPKISRYLRGVSMTTGISECQFEVSSPSFVTKDCDGRLASIEIQSNSLTFAVWSQDDMDMADNYK
ncbi:hypothetical protein CAEBREN_04993 [Caenorhabditis brenneri]|uniref:F-box associated domain-containing protein n=1 Tax=Caenorhabditis brenneri TaxID=135651 RepID=G0NVR8_CAEBE|nr:hypothetical protein CAEBREN_04993 [Caenorhabditis brenneri]